MLEVRNVNPNKLQDEFIASNILPLSVTNTPVVDNRYAEKTWIRFKDDVDMVLVQQIIDAHDPTPLPQPLSEIDQLKISQAEQFETILALIGGM